MNQELYRPSFTLLTDLSQLTMAYGYCELGMSYVTVQNREWQNRIKSSNSPIKTSNLRMLQTRRFYNEEGKSLGDVFYNIHRESNYEMLELNEDPIRQQFSETHSFEHSLEPVLRPGKQILLQNIS